MPRLCAPLPRLHPAPAPAALCRGPRLQRISSTAPSVAFPAPAATPHLKLLMLSRLPALVQAVGGSRLSKRSFRGGVAAGAGRQLLPSRRTSGWRVVSRYRRRRSCSSWARSWRCRTLRTAAEPCRRRSGQASSTIWSHASPGRQRSRPTARRLLHLQPGNAATLHRHVMLMTKHGMPAAEVWAAFEAALRAARDENSYSLTTAPAMNAATYLIICCTWRLADVQPLIAAAERGLQLCRRWVPRGRFDHLAAQLARLQERVQRAAGSAGSDPAALQPLGYEEGSPGQEGLWYRPVPRCDGCDRPAPSVRRCSAGCAAAYCSTACQCSHWPQHKAACRRLAAQRDAAPVAQL